MVWRCVLGGDRIAVSRPGRDAFSTNPVDLLLNIGVNSGQILEMGLASLTITLGNQSTFIRATGRYNYTRDYGQWPDVRVFGIENGEVRYPPLNGGNVKWNTRVTPQSSYCDISLDTAGGITNNGTRPNQALVILFRKAF